MCTLAAPPAGWLLSWQQLVPTTARWTSPWGWSIASRDASQKGKAPGRYKFQEEEPGQFPRPGFLYWTDSERQPLVGKCLSHIELPISQLQGSLIHSDLSAPERSFPISSPREGVHSQQLQSEFPEEWPQRDILKSPSFSNRYGPYGTPQTETLISMVIFSTGVWATGIFLFRQTLKLLLSYHGWMFEMHSKTSHATKIWAVSRSTGGCRHLV